jgi:uncharacterized protein YjiS (DUF1127 family)
MALAHDVSPEPHAYDWLFDTIAIWFERTRQRACLATLSPRDQHDLGLTQAAVDFEADKPFWRG